MAENKREGMVKATETTWQTKPLEISRIKILIRKFLIIYIFRFIIEHTQVNFLISATSVTKSSEAGT